MKWNDKDGMEVSTYWRCPGPPNCDQCIFYKKKISKNGKYIVNKIEKKKKKK